MKTAAKLALLSAVSGAALILPAQAQSVFRADELVASNNVETAPAATQAAPAEAVAAAPTAGAEPLKTPEESDPAPQTTGTIAVNDVNATPEVTATTEKKAAETAIVKEPDSLFAQTLASMRDPVSIGLESAISELTDDEDAGDDAAAIADFYKGNEFKPVFTDGPSFNARGEAIISVLISAGDEGLDPKAYTVEGATPALREIALVRAALKYGHHAYSGAVDSSKIHPLVTVEPPKITGKDIIAGLTSEADAGKWLTDLNPQHEGYKGLRTILAKLQAKEADEKQVVIPAGKLLRPGKRDERVALLRERFDLSAPENEADADLYDDTAVDAVKAFQVEQGLTKDGIIGPNTLEFLNRGPAGDIASVKANMERWRWLPRSLGERYVIVNIPEFVVRIVDGGVEQHQTRVVVGKKSNQTPVFSDVMEYVDVNPSWNVPRSIAVKEMLPSIQADPNYFSNHNFQVVTNSGQVVDPRTVNWSAYNGSTLPYRFRQPPGAGNALGRIKFMFPNKHHVYLHDTPSKSLFQRTSRAFSHGCVRVHNPIDFASALLTKDTAVSSGMISNRLKSGQPGELRLSRQLPVHLVYFNAWADADGNLQRAPDIYGHDSAVQAALTGDYSDYDRKLASHRAQKVAKFDPQAAAQIQNAPPQKRERRRGLLGALFGNR